MTEIILQETKVTRSENEANQLVIIRSIKLQMTLTDIDAHRNYVEENGDIFNVAKALRKSLVNLI